MAAGSLASNRRFRLLLMARLTSSLGNGFGRVALAFAVLGLPHAAPWQLSAVLTAQAAPQLALVLVGGVVADRFGRARVMVGSEAAAALAWAGLAGATAGRAPAPVLVGLALAAGTATALFLPALSGLVPELVGASQLRRANALVRVGQNVALLFGLAGAGPVTASLGPAWALGLNCLSFAASAGLLAAVRVPPTTRRPGRPIADLREGVKEFLSRQWLWAVSAQYAFVVAAVNAYVGVLGPLECAQGLGGAATWSLLAGAQALGTLAGAALAARVRVRRPILTAVLATFPAAAPMALLGTGAPVSGCVVAMFAAGACADVGGVLCATTMQREVPLAAMSRVSALDLFLSLALAPLGIGFAGPAAAAVGGRAALFGAAGVVVLATAVALLFPQVRRLRARPEAELG